MSLTKKDLQLIREVLRPDFEYIQKKFEEVDKRFDKLEHRMTDMEHTLTAAFKEIVNDMYDLSPSRDEFNNLERRVTHLEQKIH